MSNNETDNACNSKLIMIAYNNVCNNNNNSKIIKLIIQFIALLAIHEAIRTRII